MRCEAAAERTLTQCQPSPSPSRQSQGGLTESQTSSIDDPELKTTLRMIGN
jgi:hypothetical protein